MCKNVDLNKRDYFAKCKCARSEKKTADFKGGLSGRADGKEGRWFKEMARNTEGVLGWRLRVRCMYARPLTSAS